MIPVFERISTEVTYRIDGLFFCRDKYLEGYLVNFKGLFQYWTNNNRLIRKIIVN